MSLPGMIPLFPHPQIVRGPYPLKPVIPRPQAVGLALHHFLSHSLSGVLDHLLYSECFLWLPILISAQWISRGGGERRRGSTKHTISQPPPRGTRTSTLGAGLWTLPVENLSQWLCGWARFGDQRLRHTVPVFWWALSSPELTCSSASRSDVTSSLKSSVSSAVKNDFFFPPARLALWPFYSEPFIFLLLDDKFLKCRECILFIPMCILQLPGNQLIFNSCSNVKGIMQSNNPSKNI